MRRRDDGIVRFARDVIKAFKDIEEVLQKLAYGVAELDERLRELEEYVAGDDRAGRD